MSPVPDNPTVISAEGAFGRVESETPEDHNGQLRVLVTFDSGERLWVPAENLILQEDGHFQLTTSLAELSLQHTLPTMAARPEALDAALADGAAAPAPSPTGKPAPEQPLPEPAAPEDRLDEPHFPEPPVSADLPEAPAAGIEHVQLSRVVDSYREDVGALLLREEVDIHRVPVNEYVDEAPPIRYEDDRIIIPVVEEELRVEKRLLVKEEVVVVKRHTQVAAEQRELRQRTHVLAAPSGPAAAGTATDRYRRHYEEQSFPGARGFAYYEPAYRFGALLQSAARYRDWPWEQLEPEARALWERDNPGTWAHVQPAVRFAWGAPRAEPT